MSPSKIRKSRGPASDIIRDLCSEYRNSDIRADNPELQLRLNTEIERLQAALEEVRSICSIPRFTTAKRCWDLVNNTLETNPKSGLTTEEWVAQKSTPAANARMAQETNDAA